MAKILNYKHLKKRSRKKYTLYKRFDANADVHLIQLFYIFILMFIAFLLLIHGRRDSKNIATHPDQDLNEYVLQIIKSYSTGNYPYLLNEDYQNYSGVTTNIVYRGQTLLKAHMSGNRASHCVGITFEVFFKAMQERNKRLGKDKDDFNSMTADDMKDFIRTWYVAKGEKKYSNCAAAIVNYGLGKRIKKLWDAKPGDFIDISRENNTGHTAIFINWLTDKGRIIGVRYWSSQESTNGIGYKDEYFNVKRDDGEKFGNVMIDMVYIGRVGPVSKYRPFR